MVIFKTDKENLRAPLPESVVIFFVLKVLTAVKDEFCPILLAFL